MSYAARIVWQRDPADLGRAISELGERVSHQALTQVLEREGKAIEAEMKRNAPWADRTGEARRKLTVEVMTTGAATTLTLAHGVEYGKWLELAHGGRWAIVGPTTMQAGPRVMSKLHGLMEKAAPRGGGWQSW